MSPAAELWNPGWTLLDHTADIRIEVRGRSAGDLFIHAAQGLTTLLDPGDAEADRRDSTSEKEGARTERISLDLEGDGLEELLVAWLREILFLNQVRGFRMEASEIQQLTMERLTAVIEGRVRGDRVAPPDLEIKGVTYHGLAVTETEEGFTALVVFDV
jgi:SHS2 domain-containing protein